MHKYNNAFDIDQNFITKEGNIMIIFIKKNKIDFFKNLKACCVIF